MSTKKNKYFLYPTSLGHAKSAQGNHWEQVMTRKEQPPHGIVNDMPLQKRNAPLLFCPYCNPVPRYQKIFRLPIQWYVPMYIRSCSEIETPACLVLCCYSSHRIWHKPPTQPTAQLGWHEGWQVNQDKTTRETLDKLDHHIILFCCFLLLPWGSVSWPRTENGQRQKLARENKQLEKTEEEKATKPSHPSPTPSTPIHPFRLCNKKRTPAATIHLVLQAKNPRTDKNAIRTCPCIPFIYGNMYFGIFYSFVSAWSVGRKRKPEMHG